MQTLDLQVFDTFPLLETQRLFLRALNSADASAVFKMRKSNAVNRFIARETPLNAIAMSELVEQCASAFTEKRGIAWAGEMKTHGGNIIGTCGFNRIDHENLRAEIGGEMSETYWGRKLALEASEAIVNFGFESLKLHSIEAKVLPGNRSAIALLHALGFKREAYFKDRFLFQQKFYDMAVYSLVK